MLCFASRSCPGSVLGQGGVSPERTPPHPAATSEGAAAVQQFGFSPGSMGSYSNREPLAAAFTFMTIKEARPHFLKLVPVTLHAAVPPACRQHDSINQQLAHWPKQSRG